MNAFELFSGIGGMHYAFGGSGLDVNVIAALDINTTANRVYLHNFPQADLMERNVQCLSENSFDKLNIEIISMSPPCQPFTRLGLQKGHEDNRSSALHHLLKILPKVTTVQYIILENVVGFETSATRDDVIEVLKKANFRYQEFILSPKQFSIPNSRSRYYLLAKKKDINFVFKEINGIHYSIPNISDKTTLELVDFYKHYGEKCISSYIIESTDNEEYNVPDRILTKYANVFDIVTKNSTNTCCFTKAYSHYIEGTGSVFCPLAKDDIDQVYSDIKNYDKDSIEYLELMRSLKLRFFSPEEVSRLMCFPDSFVFPQSLTRKQKYRLLGNSINVHVVALLIRLLVLS